MGSIVAIVVAITIGSLVMLKWDKWAVRKIEYKRYLDKDRIFPGEQVIMTTEIVNRKLLPLPWIEVATEVPNSFSFNDQKTVKYSKEGNKIYRVVTSLISYQRVRRRNSLICEARGYFNIYDLDLSIGDFFGVKTAEMKVTYPMKLIVYPKIKPLEELIVPYKEPQGEISVKRWIMPDPIQVIGAREYTSRDSYNTIDWKTTARMGEMYVKKFDFTANPSLMMFLDVQTSKVYWQDVNTDFIENGIEIIAAMTERAIKEGVPVGYTSNGYFNGENPSVFINPEFRRSQRVAILEALAKTSYSRRLPLDKLINMRSKQLDRGSCIVIATAHVSDGLRNEINYLAKQGYMVKVILLDNDARAAGLKKEVELIYSKNSGLLAG
ncbi:MAG: DUF58 domain-containing protein [Firmicutes bacterium]|nr:DUF58 domain-containing protein [Bacillota bacterium]